MTANSNLFWFDNSAIMVRLNGDKYTTHRKITKKEEERIEYYLKNEVFKGDESVVLVNNGVNYNLKQEYNKILAKKNAEETFKPNVTKAVQELIDSSMEAYYFEQIGEYIIKFKDLEEGLEKANVLSGLYELLMVYNKFVPKEKQILDINILLGETNE